MPLRRAGLLGAIAWPMLFTFIGVAVLVVESASSDCVEGALQRFMSTHELQRYVANMSSAYLQPSYGVVAEATMDSGSGNSSPPSAGQSESVTNNQEEGVDEGGIVKAYGEFLIVLRRGRLFTVRLGDDTLEPVSTVDAFGPGTTPASWYDEILIVGSTVVVIGFSYHTEHGSGATEIGLFPIDPNGMLEHHSSYHLSSNDYFSSRNYASRLIGSKLILYMPHQLIGLRYDGAADPEKEVTYPTFGMKGGDEWSGIVADTDIYTPLPNTDGPILHTVVTCTLTGIGGAALGLQCTARGVLGPPGRVFYVSRNTVYVWVAAEGSTSAILYRLPLEAGMEPSALRVGGAPVDQLSFKEEEVGQLSVLVRSEGVGDGMWNAEASSGAVALLRVPLSMFQSGRYCLTNAAHFIALPTPASSRHRLAFQNRHVGNFILYGLGSGWDSSGPGHGDTIYVYDRRNGGVATRLPLPHAVDRIEAMDDDAVAIGSDGADLHFSTVVLQATPRIAGRLVRKGATQGETRTHGFFYKRTGHEQGVLGLPLRGAPEPGWSQLVDAGASVLYVRRNGHEFASHGELFARDGGAPDNCQASCVDWYGNSRPLFYNGRVLALLGYELVEGRSISGSFVESNRVHLMPTARGTMSLAGKASNDMTIISASGLITEVSTTARARSSKIILSIGALIVLWCPLLVW